MARSFSDALNNFYVWINRTNKQPTPGAEAYAFAKQELPLYEWKGPGEIVRGQFQAFVAPSYVPQSVVPTGIAGIQAGQMALAGLMNNPPNLVISQ